jgi:hypothetical protein
MRRIALALPIFLALAAASASLAAVTLTGTYTTTIKGAPLKQFNGVWTVKLAAGGKYSILLGTTTLISGQATFAGHQITFQRETGPAACLGTAAKGVYTWQLVGRTLRFTRVKDSCAGRRLVLGNVFSKAR